MFSPRSRATLDQPLNHGRLCPHRHTVTVDLVNHPDRLKYPMRRRGPRQSGQWDRITWDEALDEISAERLLEDVRNFGPESIAMGTGTGRHHIRWVSGASAMRCAHELVRTGLRLVRFHPRVNTRILTFGDFPVSDFTGGTPPGCMLFWGHNPLNSGPDGETRFNVREALDANPKIIVVDPRDELTRRADKMTWLQLRPARTMRSASPSSMSSSRKTSTRRFVRDAGLLTLSPRRGVKAYTPEWAEPITTGFPPTRSAPPRACSHAPNWQ